MKVLTINGIVECATCGSHIDNPIHIIGAVCIG